MKDIKIIIATHKTAEFPTDPLYLPIHVGKEGKNYIGLQGDDTGDNISLKNPYYSELTGIYWAWKNLNSDYIGLVHYRRYFSHYKRGNDLKSLLTSTQAQELCEQYDIILPRKRKYYIETLFSHYSNTHDIEHLLVTKQIINDQCPEFLNAFNLVMKRRGAHLFNMFIMKRERLDSYCSWLFPILFELENRLEYKKLPPFEARLFGRVSELLLDVWLAKTNVKYKEIGWVHIGKVKWIKKIRSFLFAKYAKKKYNSSF